MPNDVHPLVGVLIKPFGVAKQRLSPRLDAAARSLLGKQIAAHTLRTVAEAGADVVVVTGDEGVASWAAGLGVGTLSEGPLGGLDAAVAALQDVALGSPRRRPWLALHADLPMLIPEDVLALVAALSATSAVIAPSHDGGTSALGAARRMATRYGTASYHHHLRRLQLGPDGRVITRPGLAFDLDTVDDLDLMTGYRRAGWLRDRVAAIDSAP